jgi:hypothetical protein
MHPYDIEACEDRYPKGGVAPLRHELATYEYVERQRQKSLARPQSRRPTMNAVNAQRQVCVDRT